MTTTSTTLPSTKPELPNPAPPLEEHYDIIIAGGGVSGLSLAYYLAHSPLRGRSTLIIDKDSKERNDRTLCFWTSRPTPFDGIVYRSWERLRFIADDFSEAVSVSPYAYRMIRGIDFYHFVRQDLTASGGVSFLHGKVDRIEDGSDSAAVYVGDQRFTGQWVFDSRFKDSDLTDSSGHTPYHHLKQHFKGWVIETPDPQFDPQTATLFDFRTPQKREMRFFYLLPISDRKALVEYVLLSKENTTQAMKDYVENVLGIADYRVLSEEGGVSPLTDYPFRRRIGRHIMTIGTAGGRIKPTSGYAFQRIQRDSQAIVASLLKNDHPFQVPADPYIYRLCDSLMLHVMTRYGDRMKPIFTLLFKNNPIRRIFHFLDENSSLQENLSLIASLPPQLFLRALFELAVLHRV